MKGWFELLGNGRFLAALFIIILVVCLFPATQVHAASYSRDLTETLALSDSVQVHKYSPILESVSLSDSLVANKFTPRSESLSISDSLQVTVYRLNTSDVSEDLLFSDALGVTVYRYYSKDALGELSLSDSLVANKFTPSYDNLSLSDVVVVEVYRPEGGAFEPRYYLKIDLCGVKQNCRISRTGEILKTIDSVSADGVLTIYIAKGSMVKNQDGKRLRTLQVTVDENPASPPEGEYIIGPAYDFEPNGATFDPSMTLTWCYDPGELREGVNEEDLALACYDEDAHDWVKLECLLDTVNHTITAQVSHFTAFAVLGLEPAPAALAVTNLTISPGKVNTGEDVGVSVSVANGGDLTGSCQITLKVDNVVVGVKEVTVPSRAIKQVAFTISEDSAGTYSVDVNGLTGLFVVEEVEGVAPTPTQQPAPPSPPASPPKGTNWWLVSTTVLAAVMVVGSVSYFVVRKRRKAKGY